MTEYDPLEIRKYAYGKKVDPADYASFVASESPQMLRDQMGLLRGVAGDSGLSSLYPTTEGALADKIQELRGQRLGDIQSASDREVLFDHAGRLRQGSDVIAQQRQLEMQEFLRRQAEKAAKDQKRRALVSGVLGIGGAAAGGIVGGPAGAAVGAGIGTGIGAYI